MRRDVVENAFRPAAVAKHLDSAHRVKVEGRARLIVPIVDQAQHRPALLVLSKPPRVSAHGGLDRAHMPAQRVGFRHRGHELPRVFARRGGQSWVRGADREIWRSRWPEPKAGVDRGGAHTLGVPAPWLRGGSDEGPGPLTPGSGRMGSKDPVGIPGPSFISISRATLTGGARAAGACRP